MIRRLKQFKEWYKKPVDFHIRFRKPKRSTWIILGLLIYIFWNHVVSAASIPPEFTPITSPKVVAVKTIKPIKAAKIKLVAKLPVEAPKPVVAAPSTSGCTTYHSSGALEQIILHESGGNTCATNPGGCFGLLQACPGAPLRLACGGNPSCQINWFIANKTGGRSWDQIWALWQTQGWW